MVEILTGLSGLVLIGTYITVLYLCYSHSIKSGARFTVSNWLILFPIASVVIQLPILEAELALILLAILAIFSLIIFPQILKASKNMYTIAGYYNLLIVSPLMYYVVFTIAIWFGWYLKNINN